MAIPQDELSLLIRDWYYAASEGKVEEFLKHFLPENTTVYFGTDPQEIWYGFDQIRANVIENFKTYGKWTIMSKNLVIRELNGAAVFTDEVEISARYGGSSIAEDGRISGVLVRTGQEWKILQVHLSFGVSNSELLPG